MAPKLLLEGHSVLGIVVCLLLPGNLPGDHKSMSKVCWENGDEKNNQLKGLQRNKCLGKLADAVRFKLTGKGQDEGFYL